MKLKLLPHSIAVVAVCLLIVGCSELSTEYGKSKGMSARASLNGFGALRTAYENAGFRNRDVTRLSDRVMRSNVIVWTPQVLGVVDSPVTQWFEKWLSRGNHTLVYIIPDSGSETDYWIDAARLAPPEQRLEYRKRAAKSVNQRMMWRLNRNSVQSNGWFSVEPLVQRNTVGNVDGPWKQALGKQPRNVDVSVEFEVKPYKKVSSKSSATPNTPVPFGNNGPTGPTTGGTSWTFPTETKPTRTEVTFRETIRTESGSPIVAEITSKNWKGSKIIVVAGGSLLTNYGFTRPFNRRLAEQIIRESTPKASTDLRAGFLTSNLSPITVSEKKPGVPQASGMELLTVWPISMVTMHGVLLGLVICLMLLPVFGRPRRVERTKQSDFGDHLDAVAALMNRAGGEQYARARISEYMKRLHGETSGPWVLPDAHIPSSAPLPPLTSKRLASRHSSSESAPTETDQPDAPQGSSAITEAEQSEENQANSDQMATEPQTTAPPNTSSPLTQTPPHDSVGPAKSENDEAER